MSDATDRSTAFVTHLGVYRHADGRRASSWSYKRPGNWLYEFEDSNRQRATFESAAEFRAFLNREGWFDDTSRCDLCHTTTGPLSRFRAQAVGSGEQWDIAYCVTCTPIMVTHSGYLKNGAHLVQVGEERARLVCLTPIVDSIVKGVPRD